MTEETKQEQENEGKPIVNEKKTEADKYLDPETKRFKTGNPGGPGRPVGAKSFLTLFEEAVRKIAKEKNIKEMDVEIDLVIRAIAEARNGNFNFYKDIIDRVHGKPKERIGFGVDGEGIEGVEIKIITKESQTNETTD